MRTEIDMNNRPGLFALLVLFAASPCAGAEAEKTDLFVAGEGGYAAYRIPGIVALGEHTVLAYCEARKNNSADWGEIDVLLRRSTDGGRTWGPPRKLVTPPPDARPNPVAPQRKGGGITVNNPVAIAGREGVVHFLYCVEYDRCFYLRSEDRGETFSEPVEITGAFEKFRPEYDWKVIATGPGHGIRLAKTSDRLVVPVWLSTSTKGPHRPSCVATIYSDDDGKTWNPGDIVPTPGLVNPSETAVAELKGEVVLNIRHEGEPHLRAVVTGRDGATHWGAVRFDPALPEPVCMGSLLAARQGGGRPDVLLFCNPHNPGGRERKNLTVKASTDGGRTWEASLTLEPGPSGYSDMADVAKGRVLCLYERNGTLTLARLGALPLEPRR
jgi:sialidase-1